MNSSSSGKSPERFLTGKGFYIVLFLCAAVIGVSAWVMATGNEAMKKSENSDDIVGSHRVETVIAPAAEGSDWIDESEIALIKQLAVYCEAVRLAARDYDPSHINRYLIDLAAAFHKFYNACRIKGEEDSILRARLKLADTVRSVLRNGMELIGSSAPEKM